MRFSHKRQSSMLVSHLFGLILFNLCWLLARSLSLSLSPSLSLTLLLSVWICGLFLFCFLNWYHFVSAQLHSHSIYFIFRTPISGQQWYFLDNYTNICCCCRHIQKINAIHSQNFCICFRIVLKVCANILFNKNTFRLNSINLTFTFS